MKIDFHRDSFLTAFQTAASVIPTRTPKSILKSIRVSTDGTTLILYATDTELAVKIDVPSTQIHAPGELLIPVDRFGSILRESTDETMTLESDGNETRVRGQRSEFVLPAVNIDEYPALADMSFDGWYEMPGRVLAEMIKRTVFATDNESGRYALGGVLLEFQEDRMVAIATDARRLAKMEVPVAEHHLPAQGVPGQIIVPTRVFHMMERLLADEEGPVKVAIRENDILLSTSRAQFSGRLLEGRFPNWRDVVSREPRGTRVELCVGPLFAAVRQAAIVADKDSRSVDLIFREGMLELGCATAEVGTSHVELPIAYHGEELPVPLDSRFLMDFLRVLELEKTVTFATSGVDVPAEFSTDDGYLYVIMPMERRRKIVSRASAEALST